MNPPTTDDVYNYICLYIEENTISPTHREIAKACFIGKSTVEKHLTRLEAQNRIKRIFSVPRSITLIEGTDELE